MHVDAAIAGIQSSGLRHEAHGPGTVGEDPPGKTWPLLQAVHQARSTTLAKCRTADLPIPYQAGA
ncbi:MAG TPA: hypothetical protein VMR43_15000 [Variovorax sp.]|nr:hypothetical protein [Variovorax sp.]